MGRMSAPSAGRFVALRHRDYRLIWAGNFVSIIGSQMQFVAINWHIYKLLQGTQLTIELFGREFALNTEALGLGGVGLARIVPILFFALVGGTLADIVDRRKLLLLHQRRSGRLCRSAGRAQLCPARHGLGGLPADRSRRGHHGLLQPRLPVHRAQPGAA